MWIVGLCFRFVKTGSPARRAGLLITVYQHSSSKRTCAGGYRHFPPPGHNRDLKLAFSKPNLSLISTWPCGSVVPDCLWATYRVPAVLCSRVSFRLSVRQAASRVIMRGSTISLHCKVPYPGARMSDRCRTPPQRVRFFHLPAFPVPIHRTPSFHGLPECQMARALRRS